jgi:hypothetical protein
MFQAPKRLSVYALLLSLAACGRRDPTTETFPVPTDSTPPTEASRVAARSVVGTYQGDVVITNPAGRQRGQSGRSTRTQIRLEGTSSAVPEAGGAATQYTATITLPGYTRAPRGRTGQAGAWWPTTLDSIVVQFTGQQRNAIQMRGALAGNRISGEIWYTSESGSSFQLGTFTATRVAARRPARGTR